MYRMTVVHDIYSGLGLEARYNDTEEPLLFAQYSIQRRYHILQYVQYVCAFKEDIETKVYINILLF